MTEEQYHHLLENRHRRGARPAFDGNAEGRMLRQAVRRERQRQQARKALERVLPPDWLAALSVEVVERGVLTLAVSDPLVRERIRQQVRRLEKELSRCLPGVSRLALRAERETRADSR